MKGTSERELKTYPTELAQYTVGGNMDDKPEFHWWVSDVLKHQNQIIFRVK